MDACHLKDTSTAVEQIQSLERSFSHNCILSDFNLKKDPQIVDIDV